MRDNFSPEGFRRLLQTIQQWNGFDLSDYSRTSLHILIEDFCLDYKVNTIDELIEKVALSEYWYEKTLETLLIPDTEIFRDPSFWRYLRDEIFPSMKGNVNIWFPEMGSGEELYSLLIIAQEAGRFGDIRVDAQSICKKRIDSAKNGFVTAKNFSHNADNYKRYQGFEDIERYFSVNSSKAFLKAEFLEPVRFHQSYFMNSFPRRDYDLIFFRNKMLFYKSSWQSMALQSLNQGLNENGYLCLGIKETMGEASTRFKFEEQNKLERVYRKKMTT